jgi:hypothetical protein
VWWVLPHTHTRGPHPQVPERRLHPRRFLHGPLNFACLLPVFLCLAPMCRASSGTPPVPQTQSTNFEFFKEFVNGEIPIKEAVVYQTLWKARKLINEERWRFSLQDGGGSWYVQDIEAQGTHFYRRDHRTCGASVAQFWLVNDKVLDVVDKSCSEASVPYKTAGHDRGIMWSAVSLGVPSQYGKRPRVRWTRNRFEVMQTVLNGPGRPTTTRIVHGEIRLKDGRPDELVEEGGRIIARYEYEGPGPIPSAFTAYGAYPYSGGDPGLEGAEVRYEFQRLELGGNALCGAAGFLPGSFARTANLLCSVWTNGVQYNVGDSGIFLAPRTANPRRTGSIGMLAIVVATFSCLFAYYVIQKKRKVKQ